MDRAPRWLLLVVCSVASLACESTLRVRGAGPRTPRPAFEEVDLPDHEYKVWVIVPALKVNTYPQKGKTQQPMLQFCGDQRQLDRGMGQVTMLAAPDRYHDGERVTFFEDKVLWSDRLREDDPRSFTLWLRENNRSAPTRLDEELRKLDRVVEAVEEVSGLAGFKIPARRAINVTHQAFKELQKDWLIMRWTCPWRHVLSAARDRLAKGVTVLRTRLSSKEQVAGKPVAEITVLFVIKRRPRTLP